jgi:decaprenylphospho-beta-D-erythro-pentofuranosid-2-ulose 2-reductase
MIDGLGAAQHVVLIGGTSDIGLAIVDRLRTAKLQRITLAGRDVGALRRAAADMKSGDAAVHCEQFDTMNADEHQAFFDRLSTQTREIDVVVIAAGQLGDQPHLESDPAATARLVATNFGGVASTLLAATSVLRRQGHGRMVVLSSVAGERTRAANYIYGSTKAGLDAFMQGLQARLVGTGVNLTIVRPGFVHTRMTTGMKPAPLSTSAEAVAEIAVAGMHRNASIVWAPAKLRPLMMLLRHLPTPIFRRLPG